VILIYRQQRATSALTHRRRRLREPVPEVDDAAGERSSVRQLEIEARTIG